MAREKLVIRSGQVTTTGAGRIGGVSSARATASEPAQVTLTVLEADGAERDVTLHLNDTFVVDGESWRLTEIEHFPGGRWTVVAVPAN
ncbi:DUF6406 domain-containing protein [Streptomyces sp. NPDC002623]